MSFIYGLTIRGLIWSKLARNNKGVNSGNEALHNAAANYLKFNYTEAEKTLLKNIEHLRRDTNSSAEILVMTDYGAGSKRISRVNEDNSRGPLQVSRRLGELNKRSTKPPAWSHFFFSLVRELKPALCLELGTCTGYTALHIGAAMRGSGGKLITIEGDRTLSTLANIATEKLRMENIEILNGSFEVVLPQILTPETKFDFVFIDGNHREEPTVRYYNMISPYMRSGGIMIFDDIFWSKGMRSAWQKIISSERIRNAVNLIQIGICVIK